MKTIKLFISGTVQGIFFRQHVKDTADKIGLKGFVRNLDDGRVEIMAEGRDEIVNTFLEKCHKGPPHSTVKNVEVIESKHQGFDSFKILSM